jgi:hypothetical protein
MAESIPPEDSMPRNRLPVAINFLKYHLRIGADTRRLSYRHSVPLCTNPAQKTTVYSQKQAFTPNHKTYVL